jgi:uncharacterized membrane protein YkoI
MKKGWMIGATAAVVAIGVGTGVAFTQMQDDDDQPPITGPALERASAAALAHTGGGRVTETEAGDEEGAYEVEVTLDDGSQVDVHLDADFNVLDSQADGAGDDDGGGDSGADD